MLQKLNVVTHKYNLELEKLRELLYLNIELEYLCSIQEVRTFITERNIKLRDKEIALLKRQVVFYSLYLNSPDVDLSFIKNL